MHNSTFLDVAEAFNTVFYEFKTVKYNNQSFSWLFHFRRNIPFWKMHKLIGWTAPTQYPNMWTLLNYLDWLTEYIFPSEVKVK